MKGIQGLIVAVGLGVAGALLNFFYLSSKAHEKDMVSFIGIKRDVVIGRGERLVPDHLVEVGIPKDAVGNLAEIAMLWSELGAVENRTTWRTLSDGSLLLRTDLKTPPPELELGKDETAMWIPVDSRAFVPSLLKPGAMVSFTFPADPRAPTRAVPPAAAPSGAAPPAAGLQPKPEAADASPADPPGLADKPDKIGPFRVLSVGNRLGDTEVMRAAKIPQMQENVLTIRVSKSIAGEEERADKLWNRLQAVNFRQVGIILHSNP